MPIPTGPSSLREGDPEIFQALQGEAERQRNHLVLIASENYASRAVLEATGSLLTNKYAEGYPHGRYYGGCEFADQVEELAVERAKKVFRAEHVNVQPHSGSQANQAVYLAALKPGDTLLGMSLAHGGHLTHGTSMNLSGKYFRAFFYGVSAGDQRIDFDQVRDLARKHQPKLIIAGASAYPRQIDFTLFRQIADEVGAMVMGDMAHIAGLVACGLHPDPVPVCQFVTTSTHKTLRGPRGGMAFCKKDWAKKLDSAVFPGLQGGPLMHIIAAKAVALHEAQRPQFKIYQHQVVANCHALADALMARGFKLVSGGTDTHLLLLDLRDHQITGRDAELVLGKAGISLNKNIIPFDPCGPAVTSGVRLGTAAVTTRGMKENEMGAIAQMISEALEHRDEEAKLQRIRQTVLELCQKFPIYPLGTK
jgi:glycine hydroxymethyltransferase